jgi:hypothetical protein
MAEQLYPKKPSKKAPKDLRNKPIGVRYKLIYDNGEFEWIGYYRYRWSARIFAWWNYVIASWGGSAELYDRRPCKGQNTNVCVAEGCNVLNACISREDEYG